MATSTLTAGEVRALVQRDEGQFLEFKSLWDLSGANPKSLDRRTVRDWIAEYAAAFANADGGTILLGVDDDGTPSGHGYPEEAVAEFFAVPERRLQMPVSCRTGWVDLGGKEILVLEVPMAPEAVMVEGNGFPYRTGDQLVRLPQETINNLKESRRNVGFEQRCRSGATLDDLDLDLLDGSGLWKQAFCGRRESGREHTTCRYLRWRQKRYERYELDMCAHKLGHARPGRCNLM
jgi:ATP-dependent DNA helicase RecG